MPDIADYWNHNVHYQRLILDAVPPGCQAALDVGCGDGMLACKLAARCATVTGIDRDVAMITAARERARSGAARFIEADFLEHPFADGAFDFACANTALHHMDFAAALGKMARIVRPGGRLAVIGIGAHGSPADWVIDGLGIPLYRACRLIRTEGDPGAPIQMPELTWAQSRDTARRVLPGVRYRRLLLWRFLLTWAKPA